MKVFADDNLKAVEMIRPIHDKVGNIVGKGEILVTRRFSPFPTFFSKSLLCQGHLNSGLCVKELIQLY